MVCIQKICPKILRDHLAAQASSIDSPVSRSFCKRMYMGRERHPWMLTRPKGGKEGGKGKDKEPETKKFDGNCFWCGAHGHAMKDCRKKAAGKP